MGGVACVRAWEGGGAPFGDEAFEKFEELGGAGEPGPEEGEEMGAGAVPRGDGGDGGPQVGEDEPEGGGEAVH